MTLYRQITNIQFNTPTNVVWTTAEIQAAKLAHLEACRAAAELARHADAEREKMHSALRLCLDHFERENADDETMMNSDFGEAYQACLAVLKPNVQV